MQRRRSARRIALKFLGKFDVGGQHRRPTISEIWPDQGRAVLGRDRAGSSRDAGFVG